MARNKCTYGRIGEWVANRVGFVEMKSNAMAGTCDPAFMRIIRLSTIMLDYLCACCVFVFGKMVGFLG